jgi:hypothetical protein
VRIVQEDWGKTEGELATSFPTWEDDQGRIWRGRMYVDPPEGVSPKEAIQTFLREMIQHWEC